MATSSEENFHSCWAQGLEEKPHVVRTVPGGLLIERAPDIHRRHSKKDSHGDGVQLWPPAEAWPFHHRLSGQLN
jgi:hypothetical protein